MSLLPTENATITTISTSDDVMLKTLSRDTFLELIPAVLFCTILILCGTIGNSLSVYVFVARMRKGLLNDLFILLSVMSLVACAVCVPGEVLDLHYIYVYPSEVLCQANRYFNVLTATSLNITLLVLAVYRYKAATSATLLLISFRTRLTIISAILVLCSSFSFIVLAVYGIRRVPVANKVSSTNVPPDLEGRDCATSDEALDTPWPTIFNITMGCGFAGLCITTVICYYRMWHIVVKSRMSVAANDLKPTPSKPKLDERSTRPDSKHLVHDQVETPASLVGSMGESENGLNIESHIFKEISPCHDFQIDPIPPTDTINKGKHSIKDSNLFTKTIPPLRGVSSSRYSNNESFQPKPHLSRIEGVHYQTYSKKHNTGNQRQITNQFHEIDNCNNTNLNCEVHYTKPAGITNSIELHYPQVGCKSHDIVQTTQSRANENKQIATQSSNKLKNSIESTIFKTALFLTVVFILCYVPYFCVSIPTLFLPDLLYGQSPVVNNLINISLRLYFLTPAINPLIFWAANAEFRRKVSSIIKGSKVGPSVSIAGPSG